MIEQITDYVVEEVFNDLGGFLAAHPHLYVSINLCRRFSSWLIVMIPAKTRQHSGACATDKG